MIAQAVITSEGSDQKITVSAEMTDSGATINFKFDPEIETEGQFPDEDKAIFMLFKMFIKGLNQEDEEA